MTNDKHKGPKYKVGDVVLFSHGWHKSGKRWWHGASVLKVFPKSDPHMADPKLKYFKYRIQIPKELVFGDWLEICEPSLRQGKESDLLYKGPDNRKDPAIQEMLGWVTMSHRL